VTNRLEQIERIYHEVLGRSLADRQAFLDVACAGDDSLRREVESLLEYTPEADRFLAVPAILEAAKGASVADAVLPWPDIPGFTILSVLGQGGMGVVYLAEQEKPLRRRVALKLIRPGLGSGQVLARFDLERQTLARMDHPNIAAVHGAGETSDGRPYFVMEYVAGEPITDYADRCRLPMRARLELFRLVCAAVQHAHQKGVVHRDLKPSNVLVADHDGRPVPKVIDFGTAKSTAIDGAAGAGLTDPGFIVGTLEYMSPEQAERSPDIDTATDVYSLGALLYELLVGRTPFDSDQLRSVGYAAMRHLICETDPVRPSARLTRDARSSAVVAARATDLGRLTRQLAGDLDWVVLRALEKDRHRRYATVAAFDADVGRFLQNEPVEARPPSAVYRIGKFVRRYRGAVAASAAVLIVLMGGLFASTVLYFRAERALADAEDQAYAATIAAADGELRANAPASARARLEAVTEPRRQWEWQHLFLRTDSSALTLRSSSQCLGEPPMALLTSCRYSSCSNTAGDQPLVMDGSRVYLMRCSNLDSWDLPGLGHATYRASGSILAAGAAGAVVLNRASPLGMPAIWELDLIDSISDRRIATVGPFGEEPSCADLSADGTRIVVGLKPAHTPGGLAEESSSEAYEVWNLRARTRVVRVSARQDRTPRPPWDINCRVIFSADASRVASSDRSVKVWDAGSGRVIEADSVETEFSSQPVAFSADGTQLAIGRVSGLVDVVKPGTGEPPRHFDSVGLIRTPPQVRDTDDMLAAVRHSTAVLSLAFSPVGDRLVSGGYLGIGVWDVPGGRLSQVLRGHSAAVTGVTVAGDGRVISSDAFGDVRVWSEFDAGGVTRLPQSWTSSRQMSVSADGTTAAAGEQDGGLSTWRLDSLEHRVLRRGAGRTQLTPLAHFIAMDSDGSRLFEGEVDNVGSVRIWNTQTGTSSVVQLNATPVKGCEKVQRDRPDFSVDFMVFSADSQFLAQGQGNCILVRDSRTMEVLATYPESASALIFQPDGTLLMASFSWQPSAYGPTRIRRWNWRANRIVAELALPAADLFAPQWRLAVSPDGQRIAVLGGRPARLSIWNASLTRELGQLTVPVGTRFVSFSSDGRRVVTTGGDTTVRVWDTERFRQLLILDDIDQHTGGAVFTPDGRIVALRDAGGLTIWESRRR
jgi:serine/threonine protein kinase/WD40 repeat protein